MTETLQLPALQVQAPGDWEEDGSSGTTSGDPAGTPSTPPSPSQSPASSPSLRRKRFKMRRMKNVQSEREVADGSSPGNSGSKEYLQLPSIEITPSSDEDAAWSNCSTPSASPRRKRFLLRKWLRGGDKKEQSSESSSQQSSIQSSHEEDTTRYLTPNIREER
ncbi:hypothetical protein AOLI_G00231190 [Acnodon oligacanthus]